MEAEVILGPETRILFGPGDKYLKKLKKALDVKLVARDEMLRIRGDADAVKRAKRAIEQLRAILAAKQTLDPHEVDSVIDGAARDVEAVGDYGIEVFRKGRIIMPRTEGQKKYIEAMRRWCSASVRPGRERRTWRLPWRCRH